MDRRVLPRELDPNDAQPGPNNSNTFTILQAHRVLVEKEIAKALSKKAPKTAEEKTLLAEEMAVGQLRIVNANAEIAEMKAAEMRKTLVLADRVAELWGGMAGAMRAKLLSLPGRAAVLLEGMESARQMEVQLEELVREALNELSRGEMGDDEDQDLSFIADVTPYPDEMGAEDLDEEPDGS